MMRKLILVFISIIVVAGILYFLAGMDSTPLGSHFPQKRRAPYGYLDTFVTGKLAFEHGCLRISEVSGLKAGDNLLLIWDPRFTNRMDQGVVRVINVSTGDVLASAGDFVEVGLGGSLTNPTWLWLKRPIPKECPGPYWVVGEYIRTIEKP